MAQADLGVDDERAQEAEDRRRKALLLLLLLLLSDTEARCMDLARDMSRGDATPQQFGGAMYGLLVQAHGMAAYLGRMLGGAAGPMTPADAVFGRTVADEQRPYLDGFVQAQYQPSQPGEDANAARAALYARGLYATANEAWRLTLEPGERVWWVLGPNENHCRQCPAIAAGSPYTAETLPTVPGSGDTDCLGNCKCSLERAPGRGRGPSLLEVAL